MPRSKQLAAPQVATTQVPATPDAFAFMRWFAEMEEPLFSTGGAAVEGEERNLLGLAQMLTQPWTVFGMQLAMANLMLTRFGTAQADWIDAWTKAWPAAGAFTLDPFGLQAQTQAWLGRCVDEWTSLTHAPAVRIP